MVSIGPNSQPNNMTHMFDFIDSRGPSKKKEVNLNSLMGVINNTEEFSVFKCFVEKSLLCDILASYQANMTIFVPHNSAFNGIELNDIDISFARHIVKGSSLDRKIPSELLEDSAASYFVTKDPPNRLFIRNVEGTTFINDYSKIIHKDIITSNGIIHVVDKLIVPYYLG